MSDEVTKLLVQAAREVGWSEVPADASLAQLEKWIGRKLSLIGGGQDREHATYALKSAIEAAEQGNYPYVLAGMKLAHAATHHH